LVEVTKQYVAIVAKEGDQWLATIEGLPVHTFADSPTNLYEAIEEALDLYLDDDSGFEISFRGESTEEREERFKAIQSLKQ
jgi:predicted RNase H-like HicB family nuclease